MMNFILIVLVVFLYLYLGFKVACWVEEYSWFKVILLAAAFLLAFGMYKNNKLPEVLEPIAEKVFFWADNEADVVEKTEKTEEVKTVKPFKKTVSLVSRDGILGIRWKVIIAFAVLAICASLTFDIEWHIPALIAAVILLSSILYKNNLLPNFMEPFASRLFTWTYNLDVDEPYRPKYNRGTCYELSGTPCLLCIYVDDDESSWTPEEIEKFDENVVFPGAEFVILQAAEWGIDLRMGVSRYTIGGDRSDVRKVRFNGRIPTVLDGEYTDRDDILEQFAKQMGFKSTKKFYEYTQNLSGSDQVVIMFLVNKDGRSHAGSDNTDDDGDDIESYVVYSSLNGKKTRSGTVAHELLHAFGAEDLYEEKSTGERAGRAAIAKEHYPNDIMFGGWNDNAVVGAYTAYAVGWTDVCPEECMAPEFWEGHWSRE